MINSGNIIIHVTTYNRKAITEICLKQLKKHKDNAIIWVNDDSSTQYDPQWLLQWADIVSVTNNPHLDNHRRCNVANIRSFFAIKDFAAVNPKFTHIYHCDNDVFHDKNYMNALCHYWNKYERSVVLYQEVEHHPQHIPHKPHVPILEKYEDAFKSCWDQGPSLLFPIEKINEMDIDFMGGGCDGGWDTYANSILKEFIYPLPALAEQYSVDGVNSHAGDLELYFTLNPSKYLKKFRPFISKRIRQ